MYTITIERFNNNSFQKTFNTISDIVSYMNRAKKCGCDFTYPNVRKELTNREYRIFVNKLFASRKG